MKKLNILAIIPARSGSKGLKNKNIRLLSGKPLIYYTIKAASRSKRINKVIVSTDGERIANISKRYGADVPFILPKSLTHDTAPSLPVFKYTIKWLNNKGYKPDILVLLFPTYPLMDEKDIDSVVDKLLKTKADSACTVCEVQHHPYWMSKLEGDRSFFFKKKGTLITERQKLPKLYMLGGGVFALRKDVLMRQKKMFMGEDNRVVVIEPEKCIDVHNLLDLKVTQVLMEDKKCHTRKNGKKIGKSQL